MVVMIFLAVYSFTMPGAKEGLKFYLVPDKQQIEQVGLVPHYHKRDEPGILYVKSWYRRNADFGSYFKREENRCSERRSILPGALDTFVAIPPQVLLFSRRAFPYHVSAGQRPEADLF